LDEVFHWTSIPHAQDSHKSTCGTMCEKASLYPTFSTPRI
jgi:hypothetical protein